MAIRKLYGTLGSPDTIRALASIFEHELDFEFIPIDLNAGEHKTESFLSLSVISSSPITQVLIFPKNIVFMSLSRYFKCLLTYFFYFIFFPFPSLALALWSGSSLSGRRFDSIW